MTKGRVHRYRWVRLFDPVFKAEHFVLLGPHITLMPALTAILTRPQRRRLSDQWDEIRMDDAFGKCLCVHCQNDDTIPLLNIVVINTTPRHDYRSTLVHEIGHAADNVLAMRGVTHHHAHAEPWRYYQEFLYTGAKKGLGL